MVTTWLRGSFKFKQTPPALSAARLGASGGWRLQRIVRPRMARIATAHLGLHRGVGAAPEAGQVARHLHRPVRRRQQFDHQRHLARRRCSDGGRGRTAPAPGSRASAPPPRRSRSAPTSPTARRNASAPRRRAGAADSRAASAASAVVQLVGRNRRERGLADEHRREPIGRASPRAPRRTGRATRRPRRGAETSPGRAIALSDLRPRQPVEAEPRDAFGELAARSRPGVDRERPLGQHDRAEALAAAAAQARRSRVEDDLVAASRSGRRSAPRSRRA